MIYASSSSGVFAVRRHQFSSLKAETMILIPKTLYAQYLNFLKKNNVAADQYQEYVQVVALLTWFLRQANWSYSYCSAAAYGCLSVCNCRWEILILIQASCWRMASFFRLVTISVSFRLCRGTPAWKQRWSILTVCRWGRWKSREVLWIYNLFKMVLKRQADFKPARQLQSNSFSCYSIQSSSSSIGANPRRMVFSVTTRGSMKCSR